LFAEKFLWIGAKLDNLIEKIVIWNTQRIWYKPYAYFKIKRWIKKDRFKDDRHFKDFISMVRKANLIWDWQHKMLVEIYEMKR